MVFTPDIFLVLKKDGRILIDTRLEGIEQVHLEVLVTDDRVSI